jgi:hypothetical protein
MLPVKEIASVVVDSAWLMLARASGLRPPSLVANDVIHGATVNPPQHDQTVL